MDPLRNRLLAALPHEASAFLGQRLSISKFEHGQILFDAVAGAVFPHDCILALITTMDDGRTVETATIGNEGCFGFASVGGDRHVIERCSVQAEGSASVVPLDWLDQATERFPELRDLQMRYLKAVLAQTLQSVGCTSLHTADLRSARWLLNAYDRIQRDSFPLKQEYLARMLGVRRSTIGLICAKLQDAGIIRYSRGSMTILDRARLEDAACECYGAIRRNFERLLPKTYDV